MDDYVVEKGVDKEEEEEEEEEGEVCVCVLSSGYSGSVLITRYQLLDLFRSMTFPPYP